MREYNRSPASAEPTARRARPRPRRRPRPREGVEAVGVTE